MSAAPFAEASPAGALALRLGAGLVVAAAALALEGSVLAGHTVSWYAAFLVNFRLMAGMAYGTATHPAIALAWGVKLPLTLGVAAALLAWSSPVAMVLGLVGAVNALLASAILAGAPTLAVESR